MIIPTHHEGKLLVSTAKNELILSHIEPDLSATNAPVKTPIKDTIIVEDVNNKTVFGSFSNIMSLTLEEPEALVKKCDFPKSNISSFSRVLTKRCGEYQGLSKPRALI